MPPLPLHSQTALITGASRGIGRACAQHLAALGASILIHYHQDRAAAEATAASLPTPSRLLQADLRSPASIEAMFAPLATEPNAQRLDILVNNAGLWKPTPLGAADLATVQDLLNANLLGVFWTTHCALPLLNHGARIINISSVAGRTGIAGGRSLYGATKAAVDSLTRNWALELAPRGILVNAVAPGYITTDMTTEHLANPATLQRALDRHPHGRLGTPDDVAQLVAFLASPQSAFVTGQSINTSGGFVI